MATVNDSDADCSLSKEEMADLDVSVIASSAKKHKRGLKTMKKKNPLIDLNTSVRRKRLNSSLTKKLNLSINSVQKQSLRANNRALAVNLERTKQELRMAVEMNQELRREIQEKEMRIVTLERVSGLRNDEIEEEVLRRVEQSHSTLRGILTAMGESLFAVSHNLSDALHHCVQSSRRSTIGSRKTSSVGNASNLDMEVDINGPAYQRSIYAQTQGSSLPLPMEQVPRSDEGVPQPPHPSFSASSHDMSVIAEQTMCLDDVEPLSDLDSSLLNHGISEEAEVDLTKPQISHKGEKSKMQVSKLPQRVPKKEKAMINMTESSESCENVKEAGVTVNKEYVKAGEMVTKENPKPSKKEKKGRKEKNVESVDRRGTFVLADAKDLELDTKNSKTEKIGKEKEEEDSSDRRKTFVKPGGQTKEDAVKNDRRGTFVVPPNPLVDEADGREELEPMEDEDQTRYFNTDMEMTEVFNFTQQISTESINRSNESSRPGSAKGEKGTEQKGTESRPGSGKSEKRPEPTDQEKKTNTKEDSLQKKEESSKKSSMKTKESSGKPDLDLLKSKLEKIKSTDSTRLSKGSKDVSDGKSEKSNERRDSDDGHGKSVVEMRVSKPGNFEYRVSRKQEDGTRQPVPQKPVSRSRSKGKVKLSKSTSEVITSLAKTPGKPRNVFDFGDRTPTVTLDLKSLNNDSESADKEHQKGIESKKGEKDQKSKENKKEKDVLNAKPSEEKEPKIKSSKTAKDQKLLPDNPVYYVPLAKGSPAVVKEPSRQSRRSRSKPRTYREVSSDEEEMEEEDGDVKGQQRSKSRRRFSSGEEVEKSGRRTRSQSRGRKKDEKKDEEEEDKDYEPAMAKKQRQSRGRSRTRKNDDEDEEVKVTKERASRSRTRKAAEQQKNEDEGKSEDIEEVKIVRKTRSRSRARSVKSRAEVMEDEDEASHEKMMEKSPDQNQKETEIAVSVDNVRRSSKPFLESLRKSTDVSEKVDKEQAKAFLASLVNNKEKDKEPVTSNKHAEVLVPSSSEEEMEEKAVEDGQRMSVNESLMEDVQDTSEQVSCAPVLPEKKMKRKREEVDGVKCTKGEVEDAEKVTEIKKVDVDSAAEVKKSVKKEDKKESSRKEKEAKVNGNPAISDSSTTDNLPVVNDRLSQFVRERGQPKPFVMEEDDDITFSDFDKLYKHVSAKRSMESEKDGKVGNQEKAVEVKTKDKVGNSEKASQEDLDFKTPSVPSRKSTKSAAKSRSKKSSKKKSKDEEQKSGEVQGSEKENSVEQNVSQSKKKLELLKKRLTEFDARKPSLDPLSDVTVTKSLPSSPNHSEEPDKKRPRRGGPISYKERPLNSKIRRGDVFFE